jgi:serine protease AprX
MQGFQFNQSSVFALITIALAVGASDASANGALWLRAGPVQLPESRTLEVLGSERGIGDLDLYVVQSRTVIDPVFVERLAQSEISVEGYLPENALLVVAKKSQLENFAQIDPSVYAISEYRPEWRMSKTLAQPFSGKREVIVNLPKNPTLLMSAVSALKSTVGLEVTRTQPGQRTLLATGDFAAITQLARTSGIVWLEVAPILVTFNYQMDSGSVSTLDTPPAVPYSPNGNESGNKIIGTEIAWARGYHGEGQVAGIADTGVDQGTVAGIHPDLTGVLKGFGLGIAPPSKLSWADPQGHGTHVAGSIIGNGTQSQGSIRGAAYEAKFVAQGLWSPIMNNLSFNPDFKAVFTQASKEGVRVHSNSWGSPSGLGEYDSFAVRIDEYLWADQDLLVVFAAGNSGEDANADGIIDEGSVSSPGTAKNILTVGASESLIAGGGIQKNVGDLRDGTKKWGVEPIKSDSLSNNVNGIAAFSSRGPAKDGRLKPEIVAPGTNIVSTRSRHPKAELLWGEYSADYVWAGGTSMAAPVASGAALLARQYLVQGRGIASPSAPLVKALMIHTATDLFPGQFGTGPKQELAVRRPNNHEGYGRVDLDQATDLPQSAQLIDEKAGVGVSESKTYSLAVAAGDHVRATLVYNDAPGVASTSRALVNDIDLSVIDPSGTRRTLNDRINNVEMIEFDATVAGNYTVEIKGLNVPQGKNGRQPYALLLTSAK